MDGRADTAAWRAFGVVPAAGRSRRMGRPKLLLPWGTGTVIEQVAAAWRASPVTATTIVVHPDDTELAATCARAGLHVVVADPPPEDMKASIGRGLAWLAERYRPQAQDCWLVAPADMPGLSAELISRVIAVYDPAQPRIVAPLHAGQRGHPVLFPWCLAAQVGGLPEDRGLDALLERHAVVSVDCSDLARPTDLDTPDDYRRLAGAD
jgi:molybdenum cofactor cytidylyltransferase